MNNIVNRVLALVLSLGYVAFIPFDFNKETCD